MASSSSFLLLSSASLLLLLLLLSPTSTAARVRPALPPRANPLCVSAPYPLLCADLPYSRSPRSLAENAARAAAAKVAAALPALNKIRAGFPGNRRMASTLDVCAEVYADAVDELSTAANALRAAGDMNDVMTHLSASLTDVGTCDDAFDEDPSLPNPVAKISRNLNRLVTNSLALASAVKRNV